MTRTISRENTQNREYVRRLLDQKRPEFSAAPGLALVLAELEEWPPSVSLNRRCQGPEAQPASAPNDRRSGFARDFATADGARVMVAALTRQQFADLARATRLARTFAFLERLLRADFSTCGDLYTHRVAIAALLAPWFSGHTMADLAVAFTGTSVSWASTALPVSRPAWSWRRALRWQEPSIEKLASGGEPLARRKRVSHRRVVPLIGRLAQGGEEPLEPAAAHAQHPGVVRVDPVGVRDAGGNIAELPRCEFARPAGAVGLVEEDGDPTTDHVEDLMMSTVRMRRDQVTSGRVHREHAELAVSLVRAQQHREKAVDQDGTLTFALGEEERLGAPW